MHKVLPLLLFTLSTICSTAQEQKITVKTPGYKGLIYLTYYAGKALNIEDSAMLDATGKVTFSRKPLFTPGVYSIVFPGKRKLMDIMVDRDKNIVVQTDTSDLVNKTVITGSIDNQLFLQYQKFVAIKGKQLQLVQEAYSKAKTKKDSASLEQEYSRLNKELMQYREDVSKKHPNSIISVVFQGMKEPDIPNKRPVTSADSISNYCFYKQHYWDGVTFMDERVIRTPFFLPKLERYFREIVDPVPDSVKKEADYLLLLARSSPPMFRYLLNWLTDEYIYPKYMGLDAVFVHLFEKYHSKGLSKWLNEKQITTITNRAYMLMSNLIGEKAANLEMLDPQGKPVNLYDLNANFTVVVFWDPNCGHCKEEIPRMDSLYKAKWRSQGVKIFAVNTERDIKRWTEFLQEHKLNDWTHVYQTEQARQAEIDQQRPGFRQLYDITQTPTIYLLDKDKRIIAKKLTLEQIDAMLQVKVKNSQN
jgi:thiol-disulfide isomerase/thioredoxin